jgi:RNA-directed DNA polymerase
MRGRKGTWWPYYAPQMNKRTSLLRRLKAIFHSSRSQPIERVIHQINPILRGWSQYFRTAVAKEVFNDLDGFMYTRA